MPVPTALESLSTTAASNSPSGSDQRNTADDHFRQVYAFFAQLINQGSDLSSASTITPPSTGWQFDVTGTTAITTIASTNSWNGRLIALQFDGILTLTHSSNLALPGSVNITTAAGDTALFLQRGSGAWRCISYLKADGTLINIGLSITSGKTLAVSSSLTLSGTDGTTMTFPSTSTTFAPSTYSPTPVAVLNVSSVSASGFKYIRMGSIVSMSGSLSFEVNSNASTTRVRIPLPIASNFAVNTNAILTAVGSNSALPERLVVLADTTNDALLLQATSTGTGPVDVYMSGHYEII